MVQVSTSMIVDQEDIFTKGLEVILISRVLSDHDHSEIS